MVGKACIRAGIEDMPSVDLQLGDLRAQLAEFERYQRHPSTARRVAIRQSGQNGVDI